jgi:hypothetical protein
MSEFYAVRQMPPSYRLSEELRRLADEIENPDDLNAALLATAVENLNAVLAQRMAMESEASVVGAALGIKIVVREWVTPDAAYLLSVDENGTHILRSAVIRFGP